VISEMVVKIPVLGVCKQRGGYNKVVLRKTYDVNDTLGHDAAR
jgi:hypothetical protein